MMPFSCSDKGQSPTVQIQFPTTLP